jgi:hypothetical protein
MKYLRGFIDGEYQDGEFRGRCFIGGQSGYGKTTELVRLAEQCAGSVVLFDFLGTHHLSRSVTCRQPGELKEEIRNRPDRFRVLYQPMRGELDEHFRAVCRILCAVHCVCFAVDELDNFCDAKWGSKRVPPEFYEICQYGRHRRVACAATARMPMQVARAFTSQCQEMRLFHMDERTHLDYFKTRCEKSVLDRLPALPKYQYLLWHNDGSQPVLMTGGKCLQKKSF